MTSVMPKPASILILEDDPDFGEILALSLEEEGYEVSLYTNTIKALAHIDNWHVDLVIADLQIEEDGQLRAHGGTTLIYKLKQVIKHSAPVIAISGTFVDDEFAGALKAKAVGADEAIAKPIRPADLLRTVKRMLK